MWFDLKPEGYLGAYMDSGFSCGLLFQIVDELRRKLPAIFRDYPLSEMWGYKYDMRRRGIAIHADPAKVNVNFWITPDDANLNPKTGGLTVFTRKPPLSWSFKDYNRNTKKIKRYLSSHKSQKISVPYKENRVVIFDSVLFHQTSNFHFKDGYENRRVNITLLYGSPKQDPNFWLPRNM